MSEGRPVTDLPSSEQGLEVQFGSHTVGWYRHAAWFAQKIFESGVLAEHIKSHQRAFAILCKGDELGLPPFAAWTWIYPTKAGRLAIQTKGALAVVQASAAFEGYEERIENEGTPEMRAVAIATRKGHKPTIKEFSAKDADAAGLLKPGRTRDGGTYDTTYQAYLKDMLLSRARGRALEVAFASELGGLQPEGIAEDADRMEEAREPKRLAAAPPRRDPLLSAVMGQKQLGSGPTAGTDTPGEGADVPPPSPPAVSDDEVMDPAMVEVIEDQVTEIFGPADGVERMRVSTTVTSGAPPAAQPEVAKPAAGPRANPPVTGATTGGGTAAARKLGLPPICQRCNAKLNEMGGCDTCGWPGKDIR